MQESVSRRTINPQHGTSTTMVRIRMMIPTMIWMLVALALALASPTQAFLSAGRTECRKIGERGSVIGPKSLLYGNSNSNSNSNSNNDPNTRLDKEDNVVLLPLYEAELAKLKGAAAAANEGDTNDTTNDDDDDSTVRQRISELEETIENARTAAEFGVRRIQAEFYDAFSSCDLETMKRVWSDSDDVCCVHPGMESLNGRDSVMRSWEQIFAGNSDGNGGEEDDDDESPFRITPSRVRVDVCGRTAICTCVEETNGGRLEALNVYRREGGTWKMVNHMASPTIMRL
mmetsp:Transcript_13705/g.38580  ORF Transcript_13705/g.38580 Transcript_13705/m.38580 type:complete len:287 (-) Transcript_13705:136-996(-)